MGRISTFALLGVKKADKRGMETENEMDKFMWICATYPIRRCALKAL